MLIGVTLSLNLSPSFSIVSPPLPLPIYERAIPTSTAFSYFSHASRHSAAASSGRLGSNKRARSPIAIAQL